MVIVSSIKFVEVCVITGWSVVISIVISVITSTGRSVVTSTGSSVVTSTGSSVVTSVTGSRVGVGVSGSTIGPTASSPGSFTIPTSVIWAIPWKVKSEVSALSKFIFTSLFMLLNHLPSFSKNSLI